MGACTFSISVKGANAKEAFELATSAARYESGNDGYTGTIAEKSNFVMIACPADQKPWQFANKLIEEGDSRIDDKWGPAGCIAIPGGFLFFGWASE